MPAFVRALFIKSSTEVELSYCITKGLSNSLYFMCLQHFETVSFTFLTVRIKIKFDKILRNFFLSFLTKIHAVFKRSETV